MLAGIRQMTEGWKQEGHADGWQKGQAHILLQQLEWRFGEVPDWARKSVEEAEPPQLSTWARRLLEAESLDDVLSN